MIKSPPTRATLAVALVLWAGACHVPLARAQTAVFQNGTTNTFSGQTYTGAEDTFIAINDASGYVSDWNFGGDPSFELGAAGANTLRRDLLRFDLTSMAGQYAAITGVTLRLTIQSSSATSNTVEVHQVSAANTGWVAGSGHANSVSPSGLSTWAFRNQTASGSGTPWAGSAGAGTPGTDYLSAIVASTPWSGGQTGTFDLVFTDTAFLSDWINGTNSGLLLKNTTEPSNENRLFILSSEYSTIASRPELIVSYTAIPEPSSLALSVGLGAAILAIYRRRQNQTTPARWR